MGGCIVSMVMLSICGQQCISKVEVGGIVDCLLLEGGFLCVGLHPVGGPVNVPGVIRIWDVATGAEQQLSGPQVFGVP
jgi:hypothetical protein